jgi:hypothetical protein
MADRHDFAASAAAEIFNRAMADSAADRSAALSARS